MRGLQAFLKKDLKEVMKTYRIYVIPSVFIFFGLVSPIIAYYLPDILASMAGEVTVELPTPAWHDAFDQYFSNTGQMGVLAIILALMGVIADERARGIINMVFYRPVSRMTYVFSKFLAYGLLLTASIFISFLACYYNSTVLFEGVPLSVTFQATFVFWIYALFIAAMTIAASAVFTSNVAAGGVSLGGLILVFLLPYTHQFFDTYFPGALQDSIDEILRGTTTMGDVLPAILGTILLALFLLGIGGYIFNRQEI